MNTSKTFAAAVLMLSLAAPMTVALSAEDSALERWAGTLCVLDFQRLGDDASVDWLAGGLADMTITALNRLGPYLVIEREHLREIVREHELADAGLVGLQAGIRQARLVKAELLLLGSFSKQDDELVVQVRIVRIADQQLLSQARWSGPISSVLSVPQLLTERILSASDVVPDPSRLEGLEREMPTTIDVAEAYYAGMSAFDDGRYPEALAHYLDGAAAAGEFERVFRATLDMYQLLDQHEHAVLFALRRARALERAGRRLDALEYYYAGAEHCLGPRPDYISAIELLERVLRLIDEHERATGEIESAKNHILARLEKLYVTDGAKPVSLAAALGDRAVRYRLWPPDIDAEVLRRARDKARGGFQVRRGDQWVVEPVPSPSLLMWKIRAHRELARVLARQGQIHQALDQYVAWMDEYRFLSGHPAYDDRYLGSIRTEAHFITLRHHAETGFLVRDHRINRINRLNLVSDRVAFERNFGDAEPDDRARAHSRYDDRGHEFFDFAAPLGKQIESITLHADVDGIAYFSVNTPNPTGWPPKFDLTRRLRKLVLSKRGSYMERVELPPGSDFVSIGTGWGVGMYSNTQLQISDYLRAAPHHGPDIVRWRAEFTLAPKAGKAQTAYPGVLALSPGVRKLVERYSAGWDEGYAVPQSATSTYSGEPSLDVYAESWLVFSMDDDVRVYHRDNPRLRLQLPATVNTDEREFDPSLVRTHDGRYALLWSRGISDEHARRFVAFSRDLLEWETPGRMLLDQPDEETGYPYGSREPLERTYNVARTPNGYIMMLAQGFARYSDDLRQWGPPQKVLPQDLYRNHLVRTQDGTLWVAYETSSEERQPYGDDDWLHGYYVQDGKRYRHVTELRLSRSSDGVQWSQAGKVVLPGQGSGLWAFPLSPRGIGVAMGFNNLFVKWFTASHLGDLAQVDSQLQVVHQSDAAVFFADSSSLTCVRPVFNFGDQKGMLLATTSAALYKAMAQ